MSDAAILSSLKPPRPYRPLAEEMASIRVRDVRSRVEVGQETFTCALVPHPIRLHWDYRTGGCFGPATATALSQRQSTLEEGDDTSKPGAGDRGTSGGWHLYFLCPICLKRARVLYASNPAEQWGCRTCMRVAYRSWCGSRKSKASYNYRKHTAAAIRIRRDFMHLPQEQAEDLYFQPATDLLKPEGVAMTNRRWEALRLLAIAHETLRDVGWCQKVAAFTAQCHGDTTGAEETLKDLAGVIQRAEEILHTYRWATRQSTWLRRGELRAGPDDPSRSKTSIGHPQDV